MTKEIIQTFSLFHTQTRVSEREKNVAFGQTSFIKHVRYIHTLQLFK